MKTYQPLKLICAVLLIFAVTVNAGTPKTPKQTDTPAGTSTNTGPDDLIEKKKTINRSYNVSGSDKLSIENSFGTVDIKTWNKSEFKVDITITTKAKDDAEAQRLMNGIEIKEDKSSGVYSFKTKVEMNDKKWNKGDKENDKDKNHKDHDGDKREFEINYDVYMPASNPLDVDNSFGKLNIADFNGQATISSKFGELVAGKISNNNGITSEFGSAKIASVNSGKIVSKFGEMTIGSIGGDVKLVSEYADTKLALDNSITALNVVNSFGSIRIDMPSGLGATVTADCSFGDCTSKTGLTLKELKDEDNRYSMDKHYEGTVGNGAAKIKVKANFGDVRFMNPGDKDEPGRDRDKHKEKHKEKKDKDDDA